MLGTFRERNPQHSSKTPPQMEEKTHKFTTILGSLRGRTESKIRLALLVNRVVKVEKQPIDHMRGIEKLSGVPPAR